MPIKGVCIDGPNKGQRISAEASWNSLGTGKITAVAPWGEKAEGRYTTSPRAGSTRSWNAEERRTGSTSSAFGDDVIVESDGFTTQVGTATLLGDQGTTFDVIYWGSGWSPTHGQGRVRDSRGNRYRLVW
jgi:hypothetical protein